MFTSLLLTSEIGQCTRLTIEVPLTAVNHVRGLRISIGKGHFVQTRSIVPAWVFGAFLLGGCAENGEIDSTSDVGLTDGKASLLTMSEHELPGTGTAIPPITSTLITLRIAGNAALTEVSVGVRKAGKPISGSYDPMANTASVKLLSADFQALSAAVSNGGSVSINYGYRDPDFRAVSFLWR